MQEVKVHTPYYFKTNKAKLNNNLRVRWGMRTMSRITNYVPQTNLHKARFHTTITIAANMLSVKSGTFFPLCNRLNTFQPKRSPWEWTHWFHVEHSACLCLNLCLGNQWNMKLLGWIVSVVLWMKLWGKICRLHRKWETCIYWTKRNHAKRPQEVKDNSFLFCTTELWTCNVWGYNLHDPMLDSIKTEFHSSNKLILSYSPMKSTV